MNKNFWGVWLTRMTAVVALAGCGTGPVDSNGPACTSYFDTTACTMDIKKTGTILGIQSDLPRGFVVYGNDDHDSTGRGMLVTRLRTYDPVQVANTGRDIVRSLSISDDGEWVCYVDYATWTPWLIQVNGNGKTRVPVTDVDPGFPQWAGFYRQSPYGGELFYLAGPDRLRAIRVDFSGPAPSFSSDRLLADLEGVLDFYPYRYRIAVCRDQIFTAINPIMGDTAVSRTGYLTIPDGGKGVARPEHIYRWANDDTVETYGCYHTMSHDGRYALANAGVEGNPDSIPRAHKGFYVTGFRRYCDPAVTIDRNLDCFGISANWAPEPYRSIPHDQADFRYWYFTNDPAYVAGFMTGTRATTRCIWIVAWESNIWTAVTPLDKMLDVIHPAVHIGAIGDDALQQVVDTSDTTISLQPFDDRYDPNYQIITPNGGEQYRVGDTLAIRVSASRSARAVIYLHFNKERIKLPTLETAFNPFVTTELFWKIPASIEKIGLDGVQEISLVTSDARVEITDYDESWGRKDFSDSSFVILPAKASIAH